MPSTMRLRLDDPDCERALEEARQILGIEKERWRADVIDAALAHLSESHTNLQDARGNDPPTVISDISNTSVLKLRYRT